MSTMNISKRLVEHAAAHQLYHPTLNGIWVSRELLIQVCRLWTEKLSSSSGDVFFLQRPYQLLLSINCSLVLSNSKRTKSVFSIKLSAHELAITKNTDEFSRSLRILLAFATVIALESSNSFKAMMKLLRIISKATKSIRQKICREGNNHFIAAWFKREFEVARLQSSETIFFFFVTDNYLPANYKVRQNWIRELSRFNRVWTICRRKTPSHCENKF